MLLSLICRHWVRTLEKGWKQIPLFLAVFPVLCASSGELTLFEKGKSVYCIETGNQTASAKEGALEFQRVFEKATGCRLPVVNKGKAPHGSKVIRIGEANPELWKDVKFDGFRILASPDGTVRLFGDDADLRDFYCTDNYRSSHAGSYFAVLEFLERFLGARWYMPGEYGEEIPESKTVRIPDSLDILINPRFPVRSISTLHVQEGDNGQYAKRSRDAGLFHFVHYNREHQKLTARFARKMRMGVAYDCELGHAWATWIPALRPNTFVSESYGKTHPEYYALVNGVRQTNYRGEAHGGQLCVSNPEVARVYAGNIIRYIERNPAAPRVFSLSPNDGGGHCECEACRSWDPPGAEGAYTDRIVRFANAVAEIVTKRFPDAMFGLYAYHGTRRPPLRTKLHPNIRISDVYNHLPHLLYQDDPRRELFKDLAGWRTFASGVFLSTYYNGEGFWGFPWSSLDVIDRIMKKQAEFTSSDGMRMCFTGPYNYAPIGVSGPDHYVLARLFWNPELDAGVLADEFYDGAFGKAAGNRIREYFRLISAAVKNAIRIRKLPGREVENAGHGLPEILEAYRKIRSRCTRLIDEAESIGKTLPERYQWRISRVAVGWRCMEVTLDALAAAEQARNASGIERGRRCEKAVELGQKRRSMMLDPDNVFALAGAAMDQYDIMVPLGIVYEMPESERFVLELREQGGDSVVIDGKLNEPFWKNAVQTAPFRNNFSEEKITDATTVRAGYSDKGLFLGYICRENDMAKMNIVDQPGLIWNGEVVEFFFVPTMSSANYIHVSVNPNGICNAVHMRGDMGEDPNFKPDFKFAVSHSRNFWCVEMFFPWRSLGLDGKPAGGSAYYANFFRECYSNPKAEYSGWSPTRSGFATPSRFGRLRFSVSGK